MRTSQILPTISYAVKLHNWATILTAKESKKLNIVKLEDFSAESVNLLCSEKSTTTVNSEFRVQDLLLTNVDDKFKAGFYFQVSIEPNKDYSVGNFGFTLSDSDSNFAPFLNSKMDGLYTIKINAKNLLKNQDIFTKRCNFKLDTTPPETTLQVNLANEIKFIDYKNARHIGVVDSDQDISFASSDADFKDVLYCAVPLYDKFNLTDTAKVGLWQKGVDKSLCLDEEIKYAKINTPILAGQKSGFWKIIYQGQDILGNVSLPKSIIILYFHSNLMNQIANKSQFDVATQIKSGLSFQAVQTALDAERLRLQLPTAFEQEYIIEETRMGLMNAWYQEVVIKDFEDDSAGSISHIDVLGDGKIILASTTKHKLEARSAESGKLLWSIPMHAIKGIADDGEFDDFVLSTKGMVFAALGLNQTVAYFDVKTGKLLKQTTIAKNPLCFSDDGHRLYVRGSQSTIDIYDVSTDIKLRTIDLGSFDPSKIVLSVDETKIVGIENGGLSVFDLTKNQVIAKFKNHQTTASQYLISPDNKIVLSASIDDLRAWDIETAEELLNVKDRTTQNIASLAFSPNGKQFVVLVDDQISVWDTAKLKNTRVITNYSGDDSRAITFGTDASRLYSGSIRNPIRIWNLDSGNAEISYLDHKDAIMQYAFSKDNETVFSISTDKSIRRWNYKTGLTVKTFAPFIGTPRLSLSPEEDYFLIAAKEIQAINTRTGEVDKTFKGHYDPVDFMTFSPDGKSIVSGSHDFTMKIWDFTSEKELHSVPYQHSINDIKFIDLGKKFITNTNTTIDIWDLETGAKQLELNRHVAGIVSFAVFKDQHRFLSASGDGVVYIWNYENGQKILSFKTEDVIDKLSLSPDEKRLITYSSRSKTFRFWDLASGLNVATINHSEVSDWASGISPLGDRVMLSLYQSPEVKVWNLDHSYIVNRMCAVLGPFLDQALCTELRSKE